MVDLWNFGKEAAEEAAVQTSNAHFPAAAIVVLAIFALFAAAFIAVIIQQWLKYGGKQ